MGTISTLTGGIPSTTAFTRRLDSITTTTASRTRTTIRSTPISTALITVVSTVLTTVASTTLTTMEAITGWVITVLSMVHGTHPGIMADITVHIPSPTKL